MLRSLLTIELSRIFHTESDEYEKVLKKVQQKVGDDFE
jgi:hypothetical protein